ncbi:class I SAM-dependent methyltransferase [Amycolatopsis nalaikhensis]|uniref:Class I SAM-dependent methyltransferase n=1 Tax=Amycolatopsis nalaikhensis TaxID=715472 RepID=A0ABY8XT20_9PSEU|nr:class I SAM-dependent methyltransferase [Amycolatopsis sp. 2-2]WIV58830.1 class I SAM-dependent methyltransferase [Amycolatopsis sp. 2-2]
MPVSGTLERDPLARHQRSRVDAVGQVLRDCPGGALLDVGCGPGTMVRHLLEHRPGDFALTGCDRSAAMVDAARLRAGDASFFVGDIEELPFADATFDVALAMGVLDHVDVVPALREIVRVVRPGGRTVVTMRNPRWPARRAGDFSPRWLRHELWRAGLQPEVTAFYDAGPLGLRRAGYLVGARRL